MADHTGIEWTDATWNPIVGCSIVSPGCTNCYAMKQAARLLDGNPKAPHYAGTTRKVNGQAVWSGKVALAPEHILTQPLRWKRPRKIFVNSMGDLFHEDVPTEWIDQVFAIMALAPQHTFQVLTKRSGRMRGYLSTLQAPRRVYEAVCDMGINLRPNVILIAPDIDEALAPPGPRVRLGQWPLPNVWLGVSAEDQKRAIERIPDLLETPAAVRFISAEPLLGQLDLRDLDTGDGTYDALAAPTWEQEWANWKNTEKIVKAARESFLDWFGLAEMPTGPMYRPIDWVIAGGENGPRPMHPDWVRSIRNQCAKTGTAFLFKQWGSHYATYDRDRDDPDWRVCGEAARLTPNGQWLNLAGGQGFHGDRVVRIDRIGRRAAGRLLDGIEHNAFPKVSA